MSFSDSTMNNAIEAYGCNCDSCCMAWELEDSLSRRVDLESLSSRLPDNTTYCQSLALDYQAALGRAGALQAELKRLQAIEVAARAYVEWTQGERGDDVEGQALYRRLLRALK